MRNTSEIGVGLGRSAVVNGEGTLAVHGLGSCVAVVMHDPDAAVGGVVHVVLPSRSLSRDQSNPARFAETAVPHLLAEMETAGATRSRISVRLVGGASMFASLTAAGAVHIGMRNAVAIRLALRQAGLPVAGEALGGERGRSLRLYVGDGRLLVWSVGDEPREL